MYSVKWLMVKIHYSDYTEIMSRIMDQCLHPKHSNRTFRKISAMLFI